jgi:hypothetical protein
VTSCIRKSHFGRQIPTTMGRGLEGSNLKRKNPLERPSFTRNLQVKGVVQSYLRPEVSIYLVQCSSSFQLLDSPLCFALVLPMEFQLPTKMKSNAQAVPSTERNRKK